MFLVRSAFWLTIAFVALHPRDLDLRAAASAAASEAVAAGQQAIAGQIAANGCLVLRCPAGAPLSAQMASAILAPMPINTPAVVRPVFPRSRPTWMG